MSLMWLNHKLHPQAHWGINRGEHSNSNRNTRNGSCVALENSGFSHVTTPENCFTVNFTWKGWLKTRVTTHMSLMNSSVIHDSPPSCREPILLGSSLKVQLPYTCQGTEPKPKQWHSNSSGVVFPFNLYLPSIQEAHPHLTLRFNPGFTEHWSTNLVFSKSFDSHDLNALALSGCP